MFIDATFGTNDVKYQLFVLMGFDVHHIIMPLSWIITSRQIVDDLIEWFKTFEAKMLPIMFNWRPSCFIIDDALQKLWAL
jgi:phosphatidylserine decarboxylase